MDKEFLKWLDNEAICAQEDRQVAVDESHHSGNDDPLYHKGREAALYMVVAHLKDILWKEAME